MKFTSALMVGSSGKLGGIVAARNRYGSYFRGKVQPVNPATGLQTTVRTAFGFLTKRWSNTLTDGDRLAWEQYAADHPVPDSLGAPQKLAGNVYYIRNNLNRCAFHSPYAPIDTCPTNQVNPEVIEIEIISGTVDSLEFDVTTDTPPAVATADWLFAFISRPRRPSQKFYKGPWKFIALGVNVVPASQPVHFTAIDLTAFGYSASGGEIGIIKVNRVTEDGRRSNDLISLPFTTGVAP